MTPVNTTDTDERLECKNRLKVSAVLSRPQRQNALNRIVARRRGEADSALRDLVWLEVFAEEVSTATNRKS